VKQNKVKPKSLEPMLSVSALKTVIASSMVLIVAVIALVLPWYPVTTSQVVPQTAITYTVQFELSATGYQMGTSYSLPNTVVTEYSQTAVPPYTTLGVTTTATVLVLLALIVVLCILFERQKR